ncbi:G2/M phase-specific E3 ubiquitin-protein ligase-like isoform X2 [Acropora millepora]|uniref:G2/M phase-specific E3 ubiquitin-protein ligase-like isoform X2 n=1 Tax=Acropora millepora TaxID=45264 RepID=UPI001CF5BDC4|nr:G2/M phase-specific E3 ubiquitin-protein ligase-like isoform X2 [Acropora millepora]
MPGTKKLCIPSISSNYKWNGPEVLSLCSQGALYIMAQRLPLLWPQEEAHDDWSIIPDDVPNGSPANDHHGLPANDHQRSPTRYGRTYEEILLERPKGEEADDGYMYDDDENDEDYDIQRAIETSCREVSADLGVILAAHVEEVMDKGNDEQPTPPNLINVRRTHVLDDGLKKLKKTSFVASRALSVKFSDDCGGSEGAVDLGGPTREFLRLAIRELFTSSGVFTGGDNSKVIILNSEARRNDWYRLGGKLLAVSLCNGGGAGNCLCRSLYNFICRGIYTDMSVDDIPDRVARLAIKSVSDAEDETSFNTAIQTDTVMDCLEIVGFNGVPRFQTKDAIVKDVCQFYIIDRVRSAIEDFKAGLQTLGILNLIEKYPNTMAQVFCSSSLLKLTASRMDSLFVPELAEEGANVRPQQELIIMHWRDYLQDCEERKEGPTLEKILVFATGADSIPPMGFLPSPTVQFWDNIHPRSNACANVMVLPLHLQDGLSLSYEKFRDLMDRGILNAPCFGLP